MLFSVNLAGSLPCGCRLDINDVIQEVHWLYLCVPFIYMQYVKNLFCVATSHLVKCSLKYYDILQF